MEKQSNVFQILEEESGQGQRNSASPPQVVRDSSRIEVTYSSVLTSQALTNDATGNSSPVEGSEQQPWTSINRTRRLVPQSSLSKEVMGVEVARQRIPASNATASSVSSSNVAVNTVESKKKGNNLLLSVPFFCFLLTRLL